MLGNTRLLTLTGPGGVGKTRLALQVTQTVASNYAAGAWLVELASLQDPDLVPQTIARALGLRDVPDEPLTATLQHALHDRQLLLILDNCEHVVSACGDLVEHLLRVCPQLRVLTTSRERLALDGESIWAVPPLSLTAPGASASHHLDSDAVRLFVKRAQAVQSEFALTDQNAAAVVAICRVLEGLPMAVELAAARVRVLRPEEIVAASTGARPARGWQPV
jgi:predicted ATPase